MILEPDAAESKPVASAIGSVIIRVIRGSILVLIGLLFWSIVTDTNDAARLADHT